MKERDLRGLAYPEGNPLYWQQRIDSIVSHMADPKFVSRTYTFFARDDDEYNRRFHLPDLNNFSGDVKVDEEGYIYVSNWRQANSIDPGARVFGPTQPGRDYSADPPKTKILVRHSWDQVMGGVDIALRRAIEVRDQYRPEGSEALALMAVFGRLRELRGELHDFGTLSDEDLGRIVDENEGFLEGQPGFTRPRLRGKERIIRHLENGFVDRNGRKNYGAAMMRLFAVELELRKRWEGVFPPILVKQASIVEVLEFERNFARQNLTWTEQKLDEVADLVPGEGEEQREVIRRFDRALQVISLNLTHNIVVRPYALGARKVVEILGSNTMRNLTVSANVQAKRKEPTVMDHVRRGEYTEAQTLLAGSKKVLEKVLDANVNYMDIKKGLKVRSKNKRRRSTVVVPKIFR